MQHISESDISRILDAHAAELERWALDAYNLFYRGTAQLPDETFVFTRHGNHGRFISMSCVIDGYCAGTKWISSFPENIDQGLPRGNSLIVLNDVATGQILATLDAGAITRYRTAAGALIMLRKVNDFINAQEMAIIGCGALNQTLIQCVMTSAFRPRSFKLYDIRSSQSVKFAEFIKESYSGRKAPAIEIVSSAEEAIHDGAMVSIATSAGQPHIRSLDRLARPAFILHLSLRDLMVTTLQDAVNVTDSVHHVLQHSTTLHAGVESSRMRASEILELSTFLDHALSKETDSLIVFHPFGLAVLDVLYARKIYEHYQATKVRSPK